MFLLCASEFFAPLDGDNFNQFSLKFEVKNYKAWINLFWVIPAVSLNDLNMHPKIVKKNFGKDYACKTLSWTKIFLISPLRRQLFNGDLKLGKIEMVFWLINIMWLQILAGHGVT